MPKLTKTQLTISAEEYENLRLENGIYILDLVQVVLTEEQKEEIKKRLRANESKPAILKIMNIPERAFNSYITSQFKTRKLADVKSQLSA